MLHRGGGEGSKRNGILSSAAELVRYLHLLEQLGKRLQQGLSCSIESFRAESRWPVNTSNRYPFSSLVIRSVQDLKCRPVWSSEVIPTCLTFPLNGAHEF